MLCHSKVWSRVWSHRCNVNMNPYISVCPFCLSLFLILLVLFQVFLSCLSISLLLFYLCSAFISGFYTGSSEGRFMSLSRAVCLDLSWPSTLAISYSYFCASVSFPLSALPILSFTYLYVTIFKDLYGSLRCMRGTVFTVYYLFLWKKWAMIGFPKRFIARVAWCFPHTTPRHRSL